MLNKSDFRGDSEHYSDAEVSTAGDKASSSNRSRKRTVNGKKKPAGASKSAAIRSKSTASSNRATGTSRPEFPFSAIVGQDEMKLALVCAAIDPGLGGVLIFGHRGTGKSTIIRSLSALLPKIKKVSNCPYNCSPDSTFGGCDTCKAAEADASLKTSTVKVPVVDLPLGATEDRIVGALDLERALIAGEKAFEPGLLARANRGFLYIDEVNLLEDHLVDLLLDVAASGENVVEREGLSVRHPARFVLIGSGNPEEGELRPQLLDRYGLSVEVTTPVDIDTRMEVVRRRDAFERDPFAFAEQWKNRDAGLRRKIKQAREHLAEVDVPDESLRLTTELCLKLGCDGLRGELTLMRAARSLASLEKKSEVDVTHIRRMAGPALRHRLRRDPLDESGSSIRVSRAVEAVLGT